MLIAALLPLACDSGDSSSPESSANAAIARDPGDAELPRRIEAKVAKGLHTRYGQAVASVECPARVEVAVDNAFSCTAHLAGGAALPVDVRITGADGAFEAKEKPVVLLDKLADVIAARYRAYGSELEVDCGGAIRSSEPGTSFECRAGAHTVSANVTSWQGRVELVYPDLPETP